jgi:hypothetical protein
MDDIKELYYPFPVQIKFAQRLDDGQWSEDNWGIAFHEQIICLHCGQPVDLDDDVIVVDEIKDSWIPCDEKLWNSKK